MKKILLLLFLIFSVQMPSYCENTDTFATFVLKSQIEKTRIKNGSSLMLQAIVNDNLESVTKLLRLGYDPDETYSKIPTSFFAAYLKRDKILDELLKFGANPDAAYFKISLLDFSIYLKCPNCVSVLTKYDVNIEEKSLGETPLNFAIIKNSKEIVEILLENGAKPNKRTYKLLKRSKNDEILKLFDKPSIQ